MADALLIADLAGRDDLTRVQQLYMKKQPSPYMRVVKAIQGNDFVSKYSAMRLVISPCLKVTFTSLNPCAITWIHHAVGLGDMGVLASQHVVSDASIFAAYWTHNQVLSQPGSETSMYLDHVNGALVFQSRHSLCQGKFINC